MSYEPFEAGAGPAAGPGGGGASIGGVDDGTVFPWPPPEGESAIQALGRTWRESVFNPAGFFRAMPVQQELGPAVLYYLLVGVPAVGVSLFWESVFGALLAPGASYERAGDPSGPLLGLIGFLLSPLLLLAALFVGSAICHALLALFGGASRGLRGTVRVFAFAYGPAVFAVVPLIGGLIGGVWSVVISIIGLREAHRTDGWRAALAVLLPAVILIIGVLFLAVLAVLVGTTLGNAAAPDAAAW